MSRLANLRKELKSKANLRKAKILARFFKTGPGEYGEGDKFLGITVPESRKIAKKYGDLTFSDIGKLLKSPIHEERLIALLILVHRFQIAAAIGSAGEKKRIFDFYLKNTKYINNWDLVDLSAPKIIGECLLKFTPFLDRRRIFRNLVKSKNLWERRIAVLATFAFIKNNQFDYALKIYEALLGDKHDLIHKAAGWMLREVGKRDKRAEERFLKKHYKKMPRTMLRYAIERLPEGKRKGYLNR